MSKSSVQCYNCGKEFLKDNSEIKRTKNHFCSADCYKYYRTDPKFFEERSMSISVCCSNCNKQMYRFPYLIKQGRNYFCSMGCRSNYSNQTKVIKERFMSYVEVVSDTVWKWTGLTRRGYGYIQIDGKKISSHRLSYTLFKGEIPNGMCVLHGYDDNRINVCPKNLWLGTQSQNMQDMFKKRRNSDRNGERSGLAKLTDSMVLEIRELYSTGKYTQTALASLFNIGQSNIFSIVTRATWKHV